MIAVDTNVLLRYILDDDALQSPKAINLITSNKDVLVTDVVLFETLWTLAGERYKLPREEIINTVHALFSDASICFEDEQVVWRALTDFSNAPKVKKKFADFPDVLIINKAKAIDTNITIYTFDKAAQAIEGTKEPI